MEEQQRQQVEAFKSLWGLANLPTSGKQAAAACQQTCLALQSTIRPAPIVSQLVQQQAYAGRPAAKPRFLDVSTGIRLRYLEWQGGEDVILLLHDVSEAADVWATTAEKLQERGYRVFALDLRGHGDSQWSSGGRCSLDLMAQDIQGFILEKDLYTRPVAVVGCGLGAAVALTLAQLCPHLVGAAVVAEFTIPYAVQRAWEAAQQAQHAQPSKGAGAGEPGGTAGSGGNAVMAGQDGAQGAAATQGMRQRTEAVKQAGRRSESSSGSSGKDSPGQGLFLSTELLPWWGFSLIQAATFSSVEECAALLCHPLANLGPESLLPLAWAASAAPSAEATVGPEDEARATDEKSAAAGEAGDGAAEGAGSEKSSGKSGSDSAGSSSALQDEERLRQLQSALGKLQRSLLGTIRSALAMLRPPGGAGAWGPDSLAAAAEGASPLPLRMDPAFFLTFDVRELLSRMAAVRCHLLVLRGENSPWAGPGDAARLAGLAAAGGARSAKAALVPGAGHHLVTDHETELLQAMLGFLEGPAISCFQALACGAGGEGSSNPRRPELLDLKPLPQYDTLDQAKKALGPRSIPSKAAIEAELEKLRLEAGGEADSDEETAGGPGSCQTALAKDPPDYFGFVG